jgi:hypothetical protein
VAILNLDMDRPGGLAAAGRADSRYRSGSSRHCLKSRNPEFLRSTIDGPRRLTKWESQDNEIGLKRQAASFRPVVNDGSATSSAARIPVGEGTAEARQ